MNESSKSRIPWDIVKYYKETAIECIFPNNIDSPPDTAPPESFWSSHFNSRVVKGRVFSWLLSIREVSQFVAKLILQLVSALLELVSGHWSLRGLRTSGVWIQVSTYEHTTILYYDTMIHSSGVMLFAGTSSATEFFCRLCFVPVAIWAYHAQLEPWKTEIWNYL